MRKKFFFFSLEPPLSHFLLQKATKRKNFTCTLFYTWLPFYKWLLTSFCFKVYNWAGLVPTPPQSSLTISPELRQGLFLRTKTTGDESGSSQSFFL